MHPSTVTATTETPLKVAVMNVAARQLSGVKWAHVHKVVNSDEHTQADLAYLETWNRMNRSKREGDYLGFMRAQRDLATTCKKWVDEAAADVVALVAAEHALELAAANTDATSVTTV